MRRRKERESARRRCIARLWWMRRHPIAVASKRLKESWLYRGDR
jgi:hypothetical protein